MNFSLFQKKYHIKLNKQQMTAVQSTEGAVLLLAVPGSGKTTVLVTRLGYMLYCKNIQPESILTLTYTVAATRDMQERFETIFGTEFSGRLEFRTLNGICAKIISYYGRKIGKNSFRLVTDEKVISSLLGGIFQKVKGAFPTESEIKSVRALITYIKNMMLTQAEIKELEADSELPVYEIYRTYCEEMKNRGWMDYDDQMIYAFNILRKSRETLEYFQGIYTYVCVDEAQDTSKIQHLITAILVGKSGNLFMVGDEDQSIYGFRAAYPEALLQFQKHYPNAKVLLMEQNYRSGGKIVEMADGFIQKNQMRYEKHMKATRESQGEVREVPLKGRRMQYAYLEKVAEQCTSQTAVLYRDNESVLPLVNLLERKGIPYRIKNADLLFFSHRIVLDIQNIIRFAENPSDTELFLQIYYKLSLYLNKQNAAMLVKLSKEKQVPVLEAALRFGHFPGYQQKSIKAIQTHLKNLLEEPSLQAIHRITSYMGYGEYLERSGLKDQKLFILQSIAAHEGTALEFVDRLQELRQIIQNKKSNPSCPFILSTIHASKGLEYDNVYLLDVQDGIFPEAVPTDKRDKEAMKIYEEERRLFYVAMTRAKNRLFIFRLLGDSVFCTDLFGKGRPQAEAKKPQQPRSGLSTLLQKCPMKQNKSTFSEEAFQGFLNNLGEGMVITHKIFGQGVVIEMNPETITLDFDGVERRLSAKVLFTKQLLKV